MKHDISELFKINGKPGFYHKRYFDGYGADLDHSKLKGYIERAYSVTTKTGYIYINIMDGLRKKVFTYGEYTWFDTEEERDAYREEQKKLREEKKRRNDIIKDIVDRLNDMTEQEIYQVLKSLDNWL